MRTTKRKSVELLAPAGNFACIKAAVANGADAVYFGVDQFNARIRAENFTVQDLPQTMAYLHKYGVRGYVTLNILIFEDELEDAKRLILDCIAAGVDALIVQDIGLLELIREISPDYPIHGSTQMTLTSAEAIEFLAPYRMEVAVLGRENNLRQIQKISSMTEVPLEVFVHGALCVSYSGQCLTSEMLGGRSANRGECAQSCRLPYDLVVDGKVKRMGDIAYVLSPKDLAAIDMIPELIEAGVYAFKIEGRMKSPEYVANVVRKYRYAIDAYFENKPFVYTKAIQNELAQSFSRGFTHGFLHGTNHKQLLDGTYPKNRGVYLGKVEKVLKDGILCHLENPLKRGDGIVFDSGHPERKEEGGRVFDLRKKGKKIDGEIQTGWIEIIPGRTQINLKKIKPGQKIWKTNDPHLDRQMQQTFAKEGGYHKFPLHVHAKGKIGTKLQSVWTDVETKESVWIDSESELQKAIQHPLTEAYLSQQWSRLGHTNFVLEAVTFDSHEKMILPVKQLNAMRKQAVELLIEMRMRPRIYQVNSEVAVYPNITDQTGTLNLPKLIPLCRTLEQVEAAYQLDIPMLYCDFELINEYLNAVHIARQYKKKIYLATPRIYMPEEEAILKGILKASPDGILVRNLGALQYLLQTETTLSLIGDYSLNLANHKAVSAILRRGCTRVTASFDLNEEQVLHMLKYCPSAQVEVVLHQHLPLFHMEHCVYCTFLSKGTDFTNCGKPCEKHQISLQDRMGMQHPVRVDTGCRNTVYNAILQSGAEFFHSFHQAGVTYFRIEFLEETKADVKQVIQLYSDMIDGKIDAAQVWRKLKATHQLGVTRGHLIKENYKEKKLK